MKNAILIMVVAAALALPGALPAAAQGTAETQQQLRDDAERQLREAQEQMREAQRAMREAERELRQATRALADLDGDRDMRLRTVLLTNRARLGVVVDTSEEPGRPTDGAVVKAVTPGGPAEEAGLRAGDVIISINGTPLAAGDDRAPGRKLLDLVRGLEDGERVMLEVRRGDRMLRPTLTARALERGPVHVLLSEEAGALPLDPSALFGVSARWLDLELVSLNEDLGSYFGTPEGLLVVRAPRIDSLGLKSGDVLLRIGDRPARTPSQALRVLRSYEPGETLTMEIMRNQKRETLDATVPKGAEPSLNSFAPFLQQVQ